MQNNEQRQTVEQKVKTYTFVIQLAEKRFAKDAAKLAKEGWRVQSQSASGLKYGHPRSITVVYTR